jgi:hypothetical protein
MRPSLRQVLFRSAAGLDLNFAGGVFSLNNTRTASPAAIPGWSFSRTDTNGTATALDLAGNVIQFATGVPRITNRGILVEEARTNSLRNSVAAGAVAGTPGTLPTNWLELSLAAGISREVVGAGTEDGLTYVDMRFFGTASTSPAVQLNFEQVGVVAASAAQVWTTSCFTKLVSGSLTDIAAVTLRLYPRTAVPAELPGVASSDLKSEITAARARISAALTTPALTATVNTGLAFSITGTKTLDFTIRLYSPQLELGAFATSPIITTGAAGTRGAENAFVTGLAGLPPFTLITEGDAGASGFPQYGAIDDGTSNNGFNHMRVGSGNFGYVQITSGGGLTGATVGAGAVFAGQTTKIASSVISAGFRASRDGSAIATAARTVNALNRLCVGNAAGANSANGYISRIRILPTATADAQLQALTAP